MYAVKPQNDNEPREYFRCQIDADKSPAKISVGFGSINASVVEKSIDCYTVLVKQADARKFRSGKTYRMKFDGTTVEVCVQRSSEPENGYVRVGLLQTKDLTPPEKLRKSWWPGSRNRQATDSTASIAFAGFVLVLFCAMSLPGLGDRLGTSNRIQTAFSWFMNTANAQIDLWTK